MSSQSCLQIFNFVSFVQQSSHANKAISVGHLYRGLDAAIGLLEFRSSLHCKLCMLGRAISFCRWLRCRICNVDHLAFYKAMLA